MSQKALLALCIAIILPLLSYFIVKGVSRDAIHMPRHYYPDYIVDTVKNGKQISDTIWHQAANVTLRNQLGDSVSLHDLRGKIVVADYFSRTALPFVPFLQKT